MKFTDNMSVPLWKIGLLQKRQRKKEEEKRKEREAEEERLRKLPPWKRQAEQPKTVIIIDKNKTPNPVDLAELSKQANPSSKSSAKQTSGPLVNGTAHVQKVDSGESAGNQGKAGRDEPDNGAGAGGVSEEHCPPVHQNVFLTLERKKRKAPPPPKGSQISVIASNVPVTNDPIKSANSSKKTLPSEPTNSANNKKTVTGSESVKVKHIQQSKELNGPSVIGNKTQSSTTKPLPSDDIIDKKNLKEDVPKSKTKDSAPSIKVGNIEHVSTPNSKTRPSSSSAASSSKETLSSQISKKEEPKQPSGSITEIHNFSGRRAQGRKKSISELSSLFGGAITPSNNPKSPPPSRSAQPGSSEKVKSQKTSSDTKPASTVSSPSKPSNSTSSTKTVVSKSGQIEKREDSPKPDESKKIVKSSTTKSESKSLPAVAKSPSPSRHKPSQDLPASEIISLTNEGPLKNRKGQLVRPLSVIDDDKEVTISLESPRSPQKNRLLKGQGSADSGDDASSAGTAKVTNGSPEKRKAPVAPQPGKVNEGLSNETKTKDTNSTVSKEAISGSTKPSSTSINKVEEKKVEYPKNFRDPNYVPKKEEVSKTEDTSKKEKIPYPAEFRKPVVPDSTSNKSQDPVKPAPPKVSVEASKKEPVVKTVTVSKKLDQKSSVTTVSATDKKVSEQKNVAVKVKESPAKPTAESNIPYPDDFRKPKQQPTSNKSKDIKKDIVKPSDLHSEPRTAEKKDDNDNVTSGNIFGKLKKTKKPANTGINVIQEGKDSSKPTVGNSPKAPPSGLLNVGPGGGTLTGKNRNVVKKFEKVEFIGYNSPTGKASALKAEGKSTKKVSPFSF